MDVALTYPECQISLGETGNPVVRRGRREEITPTGRIYTHGQDHRL
jgi:hypothetical protein